MNTHFVLRAMRKFSTCSVSMTEKSVHTFPDSSSSSPSSLVLWTVFSLCSAGAYTVYRIRGVCGPSLL